MQRFLVTPWRIFFAICIVFFQLICIKNATAFENNATSVGNFGLPGVVDLPTGYSLPDGELVFTQQVHDTLARSGISFQALPRLGLAFRYNGHGKNGGEAFGRINHDRSFDAHLKILEERTYLPAIAIGLRDFIGTGWYSSEYIVGSKSFGPVDFSLGIGFGRLSGKNSFENPLANLSSRFKNREPNDRGMGGTFGTINWFHGPTSLFGGVNYNVDKKFVLSAEYTADDMSEESKYLVSKSNWNFGGTYKLNNTFDISTQYLHGTTFSIRADMVINPKRPIYGAGLELAPVPMLDRSIEKNEVLKTNESLIRKVLEYDEFEIIEIEENENTLKIDLENRKFRSVSQAVGRVTSTLQRFSNKKIKHAIVVFHRKGLQVASYKIALDTVSQQQVATYQIYANKAAIKATDVKITSKQKIIGERLTWGIGPYFTHRFFNPDLPLSAETGLEVSLGYKITQNFRVESSIRKSVFTNLTQNKRLDSGSVLPRVHSDWGYYDLAGQKGHIHKLNVSYLGNIANNVYGRFHAGLLEPHFAGLGGEILYKKPEAPIAFGIDIHHVFQRDYEMLFDIRDYSTTTGHFSVYFDPGESFDLELNFGKYLAKDWGVTTTLSRRFANGWEVAGYATFTDVPFDDFGEGSFDKGFYIRIPLDWILGNPDISSRRFEIRPITRDGGARLGSSRQIYKKIKYYQDSQFRREEGRLWK